MSCSRTLRQAAVLLFLLGAICVPSASVIAGEDAIDEAPVTTSTTSSDLMRTLGWALLGLLGGSALATYARGLGGAPAALGIGLAAASRTHHAWTIGRSLAPPLVCLGIMLLFMAAALLPSKRSRRRRDRGRSSGAPAPAMTMFLSFVVAVVVISLSIWTGWTVWGLLPDSTGWDLETKLLLTAAAWVTLPLALWFDWLAVGRRRRGDRDLALVPEAPRARRPTSKLTIRSPRQ